MDLGLAGRRALVTGASDLKPFGWQLPFHTRQVNEMWLDQYRSWIYGTTFGWQIGVGLATYIMSSAVYLTIALGALSRRPIVALAAGVTFGLVRGLAILAGRAMRTVSSSVAPAFRANAWPVVTRLPIATPVAA